MLSAAAYSFRMKSRLAISLSWVAGYTNVVTFLVCGAVVVSHVTGNVTHFGKGLGDAVHGVGGGGGRGDPHGAAGAVAGWGEVAVFGFLVATFFAGAVASACMTEHARRRGARSKYVLPMAVEALLLVALAVGVAAHVGRGGGAVAVGAWPGFYWMAGVASFAMGLQNATITRISGAVIRTTHLTGVVTDLGLEGVQYLLWAWDKARAGRAGRAGRSGRVLAISRRHPSVLRIALLGSIFGSFLLGVFAGTLLFVQFPAQALLPPVAFLLWVIWADWRKPIADVRELDLTADPDYGGYEAVRAMLPPGLGLWRLAHPRRDRPHHAPDFQAWADRLPRRWRVVILAVSPLTHFDDDAVLDLGAAVQRLRARGRDLVVCGVGPAQFKAIHKGGLDEVLGMENFAPDLDLAIARGINRVQELTARGGTGGRVGHA